MHIHTSGSSSCNQHCNAVLCVGLLYMIVSFPSHSCTKCAAHQFGVKQKSMCHLNSNNQTQ